MANNQSHSSGQQHPRQTYGNSTSCCSIIDEDKTQLRHCEVVPENIKVSHLRTRSCKVMMTDMFDDIKTDSIVKLCASREDDICGDDSAEYNSETARNRFSSSCGRTVKRCEVSDCYVGVSTHKVEVCDTVTSPERDSGDIIKQEKSTTETDACRDGVSDYLYVVKTEDGASSRGVEEPSDAIDGGDYFYVTETRTCVSEVDLRGQFRSADDDEQCSSDATDEYFDAEEKTVKRVASVGRRATHGRDVDVYQYSYAKSDDSQSGTKGCSRKTCAKVLDSESGVIGNSDSRNVPKRKIIKIVDCPVCGKSFSRKRAVMIHLRDSCKGKRGGIPRIERAVCSTCGRCFAKRSECDRHQNSVHTHERRYSCDICDRFYFHPAHLARHKLTHTGVKKFACDSCGKKFLCSSTLKSHRRNMHLVKPFACVSCEKRFPSNTRLQHHIIAAHTDERCFKCDACGKSYALSLYLRRHIRSAHSHQMADQKNHFLCDTCGKGFRQRNQLKYHLLVHTGVKPFACAVCGSSFARKQNLQIHERIHTNTKPYTCCTCGKSFVTQSQIRTHEKSHSDVKPYPCSVCGQSFMLPHHRRAHEKTHVNDTVKKPLLSHVG